MASAIDTGSQARLTFFVSGWDFTRITPKHSKYFYLTDAKDPAKGGI